MTYKKLVPEVSKELNIPEEVVNKAYKSYWEFIRKTIQKLPLKESLTKEEFSKLRTNFNIPRLGKLYCDYKRFCRAKEALGYSIKKANKNDKD